MLAYVKGRVPAAVPYLLYYWLEKLPFELAYYMLEQSLLRGKLSKVSKRKKA